MCVFINIETLNLGRIAQQEFIDLLAICFGIICLFFPILTTAFLLIKFDILDSKLMREHYGALYDKLNLK